MTSTITVLFNVLKVPVGFPRSCTAGEFKKLSRADWTVLSHYVQLACEEPLDYFNLPRAQSFASVIEAFLAVRGLRKHSVPDLDHFYVQTLVAPSGLPLRIPDDPVPLDYIPKACREILDVLRTAGSVSVRTSASRSCR